MALSYIGVTQGNDQKILVDSIGGTGYPVSKMMLGSAGSVDNLVGNSNPVPSKIRGSEFFTGTGLYDAKVTTDGELATTSTERERNVYAVIHNDSIETETKDYVFIDLDGTGNFPHSDTGRIDISSINIHLSNSAGQPDGEVLIGVVTRIDGTDSDITWAFVNDFNLPNNSDYREDFNFAPSQLKFEVSGGQTTRIISNYKSIADSSINTGVLMDSPLGSGTVNPDVGDVILRCQNGAGTLQLFVGVMYHGEP